MYDFLHSPDTRLELDGLERVAARYVSPLPRGLKWLEPCCGTGRFLRLLSRRGVRCVGVEIDPAMAEYAATRLGTGKSRVVTGDMRRLDRVAYPRGLGPPFGFAFCPHNSVRHLQTPQDLAAHLHAAAAVLMRRGVYAVGIGLQRRDEPIAGEDVQTTRRAGRRVSAVAQYFDAARRGKSPRMERVLIHTTISVRGGGPARVVESGYDLLCVDPATWRRCVRAAGLEEIGVVDDERARDLPPGRTGYAYRVLRPAAGK